MRGRAPRGAPPVSPSRTSLLDSLREFGERVATVAACGFTVAGGLMWHHGAPQWGVQVVALAAGLLWYHSGE